MQLLLLLLLLFGGGDGDEDNGDGMGIKCVGSRLEWEHFHSDRMGVVS